MSRRRCCLLLLLLPQLALASLQLPHVFSSHMVLQRGPARARMWGWASPGDNVVVTVDDNLAATYVGSDGRWDLFLHAHQAGGPYNLVVRTEKAGDQIMLEDILFGDVYICSGQSNMEFAVWQSFNSSTEIADSVNYPGLRLFEVAQNISATPQDDLLSRGGLQWSVSSPKSVGHPEKWSYFSAVCYYFGRDLYTQLGGHLPIGLVASAYGGTCIEAWSSADVVFSCQTPTTSGCYHPYPPADESQNGRGHHSGLVPPLNGPRLWSSLWNAMLHPLLNMVISGFTWYQGESNAADPSGYECRFPLFVKDVRSKFGAPNLPFFYVEIAPYLKSHLAEIRWAQQSALSLAAVYRVTTIDIGDRFDNPSGAIHPRDKQTVGARMTAAALHEVYMDTQVVYRGPQPVGFQLEQWVNGSRFIIQMDTTTLSFLDTSECVECCAAARDVFTVANAAGEVRNATSFVFDKLGRISVDSDLADAVSVRLDWTAYPECALFNSAPSLRKPMPASPFKVSVSRRGHVRRGRRHHRSGSIRKMLPQ